jgi:hypothetical protein
LLGVRATGRLPTSSLRFLSALALTWAVLLAVRVAAHPAPFSYLDAYLTAEGLSGRLVLHDLDVAHELQIDPPSQLADAAFVNRQSSAIQKILGPRLTFYLDGADVPWTLTAFRPVEGKDAVEIVWRAAATGSAGKLTIAAHLFPYDPNHQTFINVYEDGELVRQEILNSGKTSIDLYSGSRQGLFAVFKAFTASGIHHIAIGPDHILFIIGLLLLGGSLGRLLTIVTAFTLGHSVTLALATLQIVDPPARIIEPAIALSIVFVGADNLLAGGKGRDVRTWVALAFGLVHGFGFASVLRETGLPDRALGVSLFSFNLGVEIGQAIIVVIVASVLALIRQRDAALAKRIAVVGSVGVMIAGAYWFFERVF